MHAYDEVVEITRDTLNMCDRALDAYNEYTRESVSMQKAHRKEV